MKYKKEQARLIKRLSEPSKLIQLSALGFSEKFLGTRSSLSEERLLYLSQDADFNNKLKKVRKEFQIPKLDSKEDVIEIEFENQIEALSSWFEKQSEMVKRNFDLRIHQILEEYNLSVSFYNWINLYLLYGKPKATTFYYYDLVNFVIRNINNIENFTLTSTEKRYILDVFKLVATNNPQVPKQAFKQAYKELQEALKRSKKNTHRRMRTIDTAIKTKKNG